MAFWSRSDSANPQRGLERVVQAYDVDNEDSARCSFSDWLGADWVVLR